MNSLNDFFQKDFKTQKLDWEKSLLSELKLTEIGNKAIKQTLNGLALPTLSVDRNKHAHLTPTENWKKASTTYATIDEKNIAFLIQEDLKAGVRNFFFFDELLSDQKWKIIENALKEFSTLSEIEVFLLGKKKYDSSAFKVVKDIVSGKEFHEDGGNSIQELALLAKKIIETSDEEIFVGVYVDSLFFHNIAKLRAARLLASKIIKDSGRKSHIKILALTSYEGWTLYERYSNILRNETAVASAYLGGADHVQSSGHNILIELEAIHLLQDEHFERSQRMARNTSHILALESMLGVVQDPAFGSYHLENLTQTLCEKAWIVMQRLLNGEDISSEIFEVREKKLQMMKTRKLIVAGINDYPDAKETLSLDLKSSPFFRYSRIFEELRLRMERIKKPQVFIALFGDYAALNVRLNFIKNYFEILGLNVQDTGHSELDFESFKKTLAMRKEDIIVICAADDNYPHLINSLHEIKTIHKFIAGKTEINGFKNIYAGQNVYEILSEIVTTFEGTKA